jgi:hypothetical protein
MSLGRKTQSGKAAPSHEGAVKAEEERAAEAAKTNRLRALRLAKEEADRDAAIRAAPPPRPTRTAVRSQRKG